MDKVAGETRRECIPDVYQCHVLMQLCSHVSQFGTEIELHERVKWILDYDFHEKRPQFLIKSTTHSKMKAKYTRTIYFEWKFTH